MGQPYIGEIRLFGGNFAPDGWALCDGRLLPIAENDALFTLIGTTYGGDGQQTFALPDLRGRAPVHQGPGPGLSARTLGAFGGVETVTLTAQQIPGHTHTVRANAATGNAPSPAGAYPAAANAEHLYAAGPPVASMVATALSPTGGSQPHENMQPFTTISFIISLFGQFPPQN